MATQILLIGALLITSIGTARASNDVDTLRIELREVTANIEVQRGLLFGSARHLTPPMDVPTETWYGKIVRRRPGDPISSPSRSVAFAIAFDGGLAAAAWFDLDGDGATSDELEVRPYRYPGDPGARSFLLRLPGGLLDEDSDSVLLRVLVPARPPQGRPEFRVHQVVGRMGEIPVEGRHLRVLLFDGDADGVATMSSLDGLLVDLDDDGHLEVDFMSPEFASFASPIQLGTQRFRVLSVEPRGKYVILLKTGKSPPRTYARVGEPAPEIEFTDAQGSRHKLSSQLGRPVVVYFWASWCPTCRNQAEPVREIAHEFQAEGLRIIGINYDKDREAMTSFEREHEFFWPSACSGLDPWLDENGRNYRQNGVGVFYLLDSKGRIDGIYHDVNRLRSRIEGMLRG